MTDQTSSYRSMDLAKRALHKSISRDNIVIVVVVVVAPVASAEWRDVMVLFFEVLLTILESVEAA